LATLYFEALGLEQVGCCTYWFSLRRTFPECSLVQRRVDAMHTMWTV